MAPGLPLTCPTLCAIRKIGCLKNKGTFFGNFVPNSGLWKFRHGTSIVAICCHQSSSTVELCWAYLRRATRLSLFATRSSIVTQNIAGDCDARSACVSWVFYRKAMKQLIDFSRYRASRGSICDSSYLYQAAAAHRHLSSALNFPSAFDAAFQYFLRTITKFTIVQLNCRGLYSDVFGFMWGVCCMLLATDSIILH